MASLLTQVGKRPGQISPTAVLAGTFAVFLLPVVLVGLFPAQLDTVIEKSTYVVFHNIAEFFSIMVSLCVFSVGWYTYAQSRDRHGLFLGTAFLVVGLLDFMHTMSNAAMPSFISPNSTNKSTQFWIAARLMDSSAFLASAFVYPESQSRWLSKKVLMTAALAVTGLISTGIVFFPSHLPATAVPGIGLTPLKRYLEFLVIFLLLLAGAAYWKRMARTGNRQLIYYLAAFIICIFSESFFASYKTGFDTYNVLGHIYKVIAFYLIYKGVFISSVNDPYLRLSHVIDKLHLETVSRGELEREIAERRQTEENLREIAETLQNTNTEMADSRRAAINLLEDALAARRQAEQAATAQRASEERMRTLSDQIPSGALYQHVQNPDGRVHYTYMSAGIEALFGISAEEIVADPGPFLKLIVEEDRPAVVAAEEQSARNLTPFDCEFRQRTVTGEVKWVQCRSMPRRMADGFTVWDGVVIDVTRRKEAEKAVRESEERLRFALEACQIGAWDIDLVDQTAYRSLEHDRIFGYTELLPEWTLDDFLRHALPEYRAEVETMVSEATAAKTGWTYQCRIQRADGEIRWIWFSGRHFIDINGHSRVAGVVMDITERKHAEEALARAHEQTEADRLRLEAILETTPVGVVLVEAATGRLSLINRRAADIYGTDYGGLDLETHVGGVKVLQPDGTPFPIEALPASHALGGEEVHNVEMTIERGNGVRVPLAVYAAPLRDASGKVFAAVVVFDDISERKQAEQQITRQLEELHILNEDLRQFNKSFVSREFRMIELKKEINELCEQCGQQPRYPLEFEKS